MPLLMCPNCDVEMKEVNRNDVQIDMCPSCRGVWLDRGELEKLLGAVKQYEQDNNQPGPARFDNQKDYQKYDQKDYDKGYQKHDQYGHKPKKKKSLFEMFDIFD